MGWCATELPQLGWHRPRCVVAWLPLKGPATLALGGTFAKGAPQLIDFASIIQRGDMVFLVISTAGRRRSSATSLMQMRSGAAQGLTAKSFQEPGTPFSLLSPRSSNSIPDPTTRSLTVPETSTSPGAANAPTRAEMWTASPPRSPLRTSHSPVCNPTRNCTPSVLVASVIARAPRTARAGPSKDPTGPRWKRPA